MRALQAMTLLLGALAVLMTGGAPASALADVASAPPCHEATTHHGDPSSSQLPPDKAMKAMDCCVACVAAPVLCPPGRARVVTPRPAVAAPPLALPAGVQPAPEPHPPRTPLS